MNNYKRLIHYVKDSVQRDAELSGGITVAMEKMLWVLDILERALDVFPSYETDKAFDLVLGEEKKDA